MNINKVTGYNVFITGTSFGISLLLQNGERTKLSFTDAQVAMLHIDVLRNEDPVYFNEKTSMLYTGEEEVGEGE